MGVKLYAVTLLVVSILLLIGCAQPWTPSRSEPVLALPASDAYLPEEEVQWWYWSGHLESGQEQYFGFEIAFFVVQPGIVMAQAAILDATHRQFRYDAFNSFKQPEEMPDRFELRTGKQHPIQVSGGNGRDRLHAEVDGYTLDLELSASQNPVLHYAGSRHSYSFGGNTYHYSRQRMLAAGTLTRDGAVVDVSGTAWFDRQFGQLEPVIEKGWQWFALQLDDESEMMVISYLDADARRDNLLSITSRDGLTKSMGSGEFSLTTTAYWTSPHTGCRYPAGWILRSADLKLTIDPYFTDLELRPKQKLWLAPTYWEGPAEVTGSLRGRAYVELHGFCDI